LIGREDSVKQGEENFQIVFLYAKVVVFPDRQGTFTLNTRKIKNNMTHLVQHALFLCVFPFAWAGVPDMLGGVAGDGARQRRLSGFTEKKSTAEESERPLWDAETQVTYAATVSRLEAQLEEDKESIFARSQAHPDSELEFLPMPARWHVHEYNPRIRCWEDQDVEVPQPLKPLAEDRVTDLREVKAAAKLWCTLQGMLRRACELDAVKGFSLIFTDQQDISDTIILI